MFKDLTAGRKFQVYAARADCEAGAGSPGASDWAKDVVRIVVQVQERWDGKGVPSGIGGEEIELSARTIALANQVEIFHRINGPEETQAMVRRRVSGWCGPAATQAFERRADEIFTELEAGSAWDAVLQAEPAPFVTIPAWRVEDVAGALADFVDVKSPHLLGHSSGVAPGRGGRRPARTRRCRPPTSSRRSPSHGRSGRPSRPISRQPR